MSVQVRQVCSPEEKRTIARSVLEALPDWFGVEESREGYIRDSGGRPFFAAYDQGIPIGFLCLKETGKATVELAVMGVMPDRHGQGIGTMLVNAGREYALQAGYSFMQVKTVRFGCYPDYDATNLFYQRMGFQEFECIPTLWDENNPCQIYVIALR